MIRKTFSVVHCVVECEDCGWTYELYTNAQALAAIHAKKHKHLVRGDLGICFCYDGREEEAADDDSS